MSTDMTNGDSNEQTELNHVEVVGNSPKASEEMQALSTFTETEGPFSYKLLPVIKGGSTNWRIIVYMTGVQGPVYESDRRITEEAAGELGMSRKLQNRLNNALEHAKKELDIPPGLGDQKRQKRSLHELEVMMND